MRLSYNYDTTTYSVKIDAENNRCVRNSVTLLGGLYSTPWSGRAGPDPRSYE